MPDLPISARSTIAAATSTDAMEGAPLEGATALVVDIADDLDMSTVECFRSAYRTIVDEATADGLTAGDLIVLDLSRVDFVSVDGASALVEAKNLAHGRGIDLKLVTATRGVEHALAATGARQLFDCHATIASARASIPRGSVLDDTARQ